MRPVACGAASWCVARGRVQREVARVVVASRIREAEAVRGTWITVAAS
jgi:hypothetical protein